MLLIVLILMQTLCSIFTPARLTVHNLDLLMSVLKVLCRNTENILEDEQAIFYTVHEILALGKHKKLQKQENTNLCCYLYIFFVTSDA